MNHSCAPTACIDLTSSDPREWVVRTLSKGIKKGEAISFFYPSTEWDMAQAFDCNCGAAVSRLSATVYIANCRAAMLGEDCRCKEHDRRAIEQPRVDQWVYQDAEAGTKSKAVSDRDCNICYHVVSFVVISLRRKRMLLFSVNVAGAEDSDSHMGLDASDASLASPFASSPDEAFIGSRAPDPRITFATTS